MIDGERVALLVAKKILPRNQAEKILMESYEYALSGATLLKTYLQLDEKLQDKHHLDAFILGYSSGSMVYRFSQDAKVPLRKSLN